MKATNNTQNENIKRVSGLFSAEGQSIGAVVRNFIEVSKKDDFARYMLNNIIGYDRLTNNGKQYDAHEVCNVNEIKKSLIENARYISAEGQILRKKDGFLQPAEKYGFWLVRDAFFVAVGQAKQEIAQELEPAEAQAQAQAIEEKKAEKKAKAEEKKMLAESAPNMKELLERICNAATPESQAVAIAEAKEFLKKF